MTSKDKKDKERVPYADKDKEKLILRDHLAIDRTVLANERTILAYVRTSLAFLIVGGTLIKFFSDELSMVVSGWAFIAGGVVILGIGIYKYLEMRSKIKRME